MIPPESGPAIFGLTGSDGCQVLRERNSIRIREAHFAIYRIVWNPVHTLFLENRGDPGVRP